MPGTTSTALTSFSHDQHHKTDAAKRKGGGVAHAESTIMGPAPATSFVKLCLLLIRWSVLLGTSATISFSQRQTAPLTLYPPPPALRVCGGCRFTLPLPWRPVLARWRRRREVCTYIETWCIVGRSSVQSWHSLSPWRYSAPAGMDCITLTAARQYRAFSDRRR